MNYIETGKKHVNQILKFLRKIGFNDVNGGDQFIIGGKQVDACAGHEKTLLIIECTTQKDVNAKIKKFRGEISDIVHGFKKEEKYKKYNRYKYIIIVKYHKITDSIKKCAYKSKGSKIYIWDNNFVNYYSKLCGVIDKFAKYSLLAEIDVKPEMEEIIKVPALRYNIDPKAKNILYLFFIRANDLLKFSYVARRELGHEFFYQRMLNRNRLIQIRKYINKGNIFPNSIIMVLSDKCWDFNIDPKQSIFPNNSNLPNCINLGELILKNNYRSCWVIDGQHRLYSYSQTTTPGILAVSAFAKLEKEKQADYFLDINKEAKRVDPNLLWDLLGSISPNSPRGLISNTVKHLFKIKDGFFEHNIKIPSLGSGKYNFNNLCVSLEKSELLEPELAYYSKKGKNPYWNKNYKIIQNNLSSDINYFFNFINESLTVKKENIFTDGFISVIIALLKITIIYIKSKLIKNTAKVKDIISILINSINKYTEENMKNLRTRLSSEAGKKEFTNTIIHMIQNDYDKNFGLGIIKIEPSLADKINNLEFLLNKFVNSILEEKIDKDWMKNQRYFPDSKQRKTCFEKSKMNNRPSWEFINFLTTINMIILNNDLWGIIFKDIFLKGNNFINKDQIKFDAQRIWDYRSNRIAHTKSRVITYSTDQENLIESIYKIFLSIVKDNSE